jgi:serine/threonine protein kinase
VTTTPAKGGDTGLIGGRYRLGELLGTGGMADVHRATDEFLHRQVALKVLRPIAGGDDARARFVAEARLLAGLTHTGLVMVLDAGFEAESPFLVMELVDGPTLADVCADGCDARRVGSIGVQIAETLDFVHSRGIVHRDVKPANVLLGPDDRAKLADFGIARLVDQESHYTRTGFAMGTIAYVSPEQVRGDQVTGAADVYSLGLVLLEALTGRREYPGNDMHAAQTRLTRHPHLDDGLPDAWSSLLREMTALDPHDRPTPAQVAARIRAWPTGQIPATRALPADPTTIPLLQTAPSHNLPLPDRAGDALGRLARDFRQRMLDLSPAQRALIGVGAAMVGLLVIAGIASGTQESDGTDLPADTPAELREPLGELHDAVEGGG